MNELLPKLVPLKGTAEEFDGEHTSLYEIEYHQNDPETHTETIRFSIAIGNVGQGPLHIILGEERDRKWRNNFSRKTKNISGQWCIQRCRCRISRKTYARRSYGTTYGSLAL